MNANKLQQLFDKFNELNILVIGDVMIDSYLWGKVNRISPEAPVPIISKSKTENRLGGAANVALNLMSLGARPIICSVIGNDENGKIFLDILRDRHGLSDKGIIQSKKRNTTVKTRIISQHQHLLRIDEESDYILTTDMEEMLSDRISSILEQNKIRAVIFEDYDKGVITPAIIDRVITETKKRNIPVLVDPKKRNFHHYHSVNLFKPNFKEFTEGLHLEIDKSETGIILEASKKFMKERNMDMLLLTLSELGLFIATADSHFSHPSQVRDVADVSGAGDTVISAAAVCMASGVGANELAWISNLAGGLVCEKVGVAPVDKNQLFKEAVKLMNGK